MIGIANYQENLSQIDKDDMIHALDEKTNSMLERLERDLEEQNKMILHVIELLEGRHETN